MYRQLLATAVFLAYLVGSRSSSGQSTCTTAQGFIGTWQGDNGYYQDHFFGQPQWVHDVVRVKVMEDPKGGLTMSYAYGVKGNKGYSERVRHFGIDPAAGHVFLKWDGGQVGIFRATGLVEFVAKKCGQFQLEGPLTVGRHVWPDKGFFELDGDSWNYHWETTTDGVHYKTYGTFELHRVWQ